MKQSETIACLAGALAKAQGKFKPIKKGAAAEYTTRNGGRMSYDFADLSVVLAAVRGALSKNGLALLTPVQPQLEGETPRAVATIRLIHASGEWIEESFVVPIVDPMDPRSIGSASTYAKRYGVLALLGVSPEEEDDDGQAARGGDHEQAKRPQPQQQRQAPPQRPANEPQPQRQAAPARSQEQAQPDPMAAARDFAKAAEEKQKSDDLAARDLEIFTSAVAAGIPRDGFHAWAEKMIGRPYTKNSEWTEEDRATLRVEVGIQRELGGKSGGRPKLQAVPVDTVTKSMKVKDETDGTTRTATATSKV